MGAIDTEHTSYVAEERSLNNMELSVDYSSWCPSVVFEGVWGKDMTLVIQLRQDSVWDCKICFQSRKTFHLVL